MSYLHFIDAASASTRNQAIATENGCGPVTTLWFNQLANADGRNAFEVITPGDDERLNPAEQDALVSTLWYRNNLSGDIYVSPSGTQNGTGTIGDPVNLATVCSALSLVAPGSVIHVQVGEYLGDFDFIQDGVLGNPISVVFEAGATVKGSLTVTGDYVTVDDPTIFDTPEVRFTPVPGVDPNFVRHEGLSLYGRGLIITHPVVRDVLANAAGFWASAYDAILYGLWTVNCGWDAPDRGHGHGLYTQNGTLGPKLIRNCIWAQGYSGGLRAYTTNQELAYIAIDKCISILDQLFLGGHSPASQCAITNNRVMGDMMEIGETDPDNADVLVSGNYTVSGDTAGSSCVIMRYWQTPTVVNNTFVQIGLTAVWQLFPHANPISPTINNNTYYVPDMDAVFAIIYLPNGSGGNISTYYTIAQWQALGYDADSTFIEGVPTTNVVFVEPSEYDNDIAHVAIYNWQGLTSVLADFSATNFTLTETYRAYNAMNPDEYYEFIYAGVPVLLPLTGWTVAIPSGATEPLHPGSWPDFMAFVVKIAP